MSNVSTTTAAIYQAVLDSLNSSGECGVLPPAPPGKSAYEVAVANGFKGSEKQWLDSLTIEQENEIARLEARILANENYRKDSKNAASKLVGVSATNIPTGADISTSYSTNWLPKTYDGDDTDAVNLPPGVTYIYTPQMPILASSLPVGRPVVVTHQLTGDSILQLCYPSAFSGTTDLHYRVLKDRNTPSAWVKVYTPNNTKKDSRTNLLLESGDSIPSDSAASKLVGTSSGQIPLVQDIYSVVGGIPSVTNRANGDVDTFEIGTKSSIQSATNEPPAEFRAGNRQWMIDTFSVLYLTSDNGAFQMAYGRGGNKAIAFRNQNNGVYTEWVNIYTTANTTKEEDTGYLVASSPVLKVQHDSFEKVHEAEQLDIVFKHIKTGIYEISGTTGLREGDGWNLKPPKDVNGNVLCICEATEKNGVITLKTYKKKFDFETVSIVADYEQPTDIPEGATVMLRFNDLPQEELDDPEPVDDPIVDDVEEPEVVDEPEVLEEDPVVEVKEV